MFDSRKERKNDDNRRKLDRTGANTALGKRVVLSLQILTEEAERRRRKEDDDEMRETNETTREKEEEEKEKKRVIEVRVHA